MQAQIRLSVTRGESFNFSVPWFPQQQCVVVRVKRLSTLPGRLAMIRNYEHRTWHVIGM